MARTTITVQTIVSASLAKVWECWNKPEHITKWAFASDTWEAPEAENDVRTGGKFKTRMQAKDPSAGSGQAEGFDFEGTYTNVEEYRKIEYVMSDGRKVSIQFEEVDGGVKVTETFDPETENSEDMQRSGWQAILDNFKKYVEDN